MFCLYYDARSRKISALNGSGRAPMARSLDIVRADLEPEHGKIDKIPMDHVHAVTVPGAAAGWVDTVAQFGSGKLSLEQILTPAIELGEEGFPISEISSSYWSAAEKRLLAASLNGKELLKSDVNVPSGYRAPQPGELFRNPTLASTFRTLAAEGKKGFYSGRVGQAIVQACKARGGHLELEDLTRHMELGSESVEPLSLRFTAYGAEQDHDGFDVWEHPPNGQGLVALMALGLLEHLITTGRIPRFRREDHNSAQYIHAVVECLRIAFADASWWIANPNVTSVLSKGLISREYLAKRSEIFNTGKASECAFHGSPAFSSSDTVYFACTDKDGNGISFINSNYGSFGTGIIPAGCGFALQNRGATFSLAENHPNVYAPGKRPYHTIIPALLTNARDGSLHSIFGVMGGFMQPQGQVQVLMNMLAFKLKVQAALDAPRFCIGAGMPDQGKVLDMTVNLERGISEEVRDELRAMGHKAEIVKSLESELFGRGQLISIRRDDNDQRVYSAGSDPRGDGASFPAL